jgi:hypothetical protein
MVVTLTVKKKEGTRVTPSFNFLCIISESLDCYHRCPASHLYKNGGQNEFQAIIVFFKICMGMEQFFLLRMGVE